MILSNSKFEIRSSKPVIGRLRCCFLAAIFLLLSTPFFAQHVVPVNSDLYAPENYPDYRAWHTAVKPALDIDLFHSCRSLTGKPGSASIDQEHNIPVPYPVFPRMTWFNYYRKWSYPPKDDPAKTAFVIRPVYDLQAGTDLKANRTLINTIGGIVLDADYKQKIGIEARFVSGMTILPNYQDSIAANYLTIPGWSDRAYSKGNGKYTFSHFSGNLIWRPSKVFNLQLGRDKHFIGDGYRSLFLSDISSVYPYVKQQTTIWKLQYTSIFAWLKNPEDSAFWGDTAKHYPNKFATMHYISFNAAKWLNIGVFEAVVWQGKDANRHRGFDPDYLNPLVFFRPVEYSLGSSDNAMLGLSAKISFNANNQLYGQLILDEFYLKEIKNWKQGWWANKQGIQVGYKCFNFGQVKNFFMQTELNIVRPYTYSHGSPQQSYSNAYMPLAHPLGANFAELFGMLSYRWRGLTVSGKLMGARMGLDTANTNYGQDIFKSYISRTSVVSNQVDYYHKIFDGVGTNIFYAEFKASYEFNTVFPLRIELTAGARSFHNVLSTQKSSYVLAGLCLPLWRAYRDY